MKKENKLLVISLLLALLGLFVSVKNSIDLKILYCNLGKAFQVEREYTYPILRIIDDPNNYGKDVKNPFTTDLYEISNSCDFFTKYFR